MRKYFFAYHLVHGTPFPFAWVEEDNLPVGGIPNPVEGSVVQCTEEEFAGGLIPLEKEHPCPLPALPKLTPPKEPD